MIARKLGSAWVAVTVCAISLASPASACGDKLVALGGGVGFERLMVSRNPGHIVLLLEPGTGLAAANDKFNLAASLTLAGHEVFIAKSVDELGARHDAATPDLILVDASHTKPIDVQAGSKGAAPLILPVAYLADGSPVAAAYQQGSCVTVVDDHKGAPVLKAVEQAMKLRVRGQPMPCEKGADSQKA